MESSQVRSPSPSEWTEHLAGARAGFFWPAVGAATLF
jgi:hypothetical protein